MLRKQQLYGLPVLPSGATCCSNCIRRVNEELRSAADNRPATRLLTSTTTPRRIGRSLSEVEKLGKTAQSVSDPYKLQCRVHLLGSIAGCK